MTSFLVCHARVMMTDDQGTTTLGCELPEDHSGYHTAKLGDVEYVWTQ